MHQLLASGDAVERRSLTSRVGAVLNKRSVQVVAEAAARCRGPGVEELRTPGPGKPERDGSARRSSRYWHWEALVRSALSGEGYGLVGSTRTEEGG